MTINQINAFLVGALLALPLSACGDDETGNDDGSMGDTGNADDGEDGGGDGDGDDGGNDGGDDGNGDGDDGDEGGSVDNQAACESLLDALECGELDLSSMVPCDQYGALTCDIADYFTCLEDNFACTDGVFDASGWTECLDLATCE